MLGSFEVHAAGRSLALGGPKRRSLLALLALRSNAVVSVEQIIDGVWGEAAPLNVRNQIQVYVSALRRLLAESGAGRDVLQTHPDGYLLRTGPAAIDFQLFETRVAAAERALAAGQVSEAATGLRSALGLWRGPALGGVTGRFAEVEAARLEERRIAVLEQRLDVDLALGRHPALIAELVGLVDGYPLREVFRARLMLALYLSGRTADALGVFRAARRTLVEELGIEPGEDLHRLAQAILSGRGAAELVAELVPGTPARVVTQEEPGPVCHLPADVGGFVGRQSQLAIASGLLTQEADGPATVVVVGQAGIGKSAFAVHLGHQARPDFPDGQLYASLRGTEPAGVLGQFLRALGRSTLPESLDERVALYRSLLADRRVLVVLDDAATERQVRPLLPGSSTCAVLVTSRASLAGLGAHRLQLGRLPEEQALTLLAGVVGRARVTAELDAAAEIVRLCGYLPLAVRIAAVRLAARPHWKLGQLATALRDERGRLDELAAGDLEVRATLALSYDELSPEAQSAFRLLGTLQVTDFPAWAAAAVLDVPPQRAERIVDELIDVHLLEPAGSGQRYRVHGILRVYARERARAEDREPDLDRAVFRLCGAYLDLAERANAQLASGFLGTAPHPAPGWALPPAAADELTKDPVTWFEAERSTMVSLVLHACKLRDAPLASGLAASMASFFEVRNHFDDWRRTHTEALALAEETGDRRAAVALHRNLGELHTIQDRYDSAIESFEAALADARVLADPHHEAACLAGLAHLHRMRGQYAIAVRFFEQAAELCRRLGNPAGEAYAANGIGTALREQRRPDEAETWHQRALDGSRVAGYKPGEAHSLRSLGLVHLDRGRLDEAEACLSASREVYAQTGDRLSQAHTVLTFAELRLRRGQLPAGEAMLAWCLMVYQEHDQSFGRALALRRLAAAHLSAGRTDSARGCLTEALRVWRRLRTPYWLADSLDVLVALENYFENEAEANGARQEAQKLRGTLVKSGRAVMEPIAPVSTG